MCEDYQGWVPIISSPLFFYPAPMFVPCSSSTLLTGPPAPGRTVGVALAMRTSSHLLAAVRKREAMLLESVYSRSFCWNRASYLEDEQDVEEEGGTYRED